MATFTATGGSGHQRLDGVLVGAVRPGAAPAHREHLLRCRMAARVCQFHAGPAYEWLTSTPFVHWLAAKLGARTDSMSASRLSQSNILKLLRYSLSS